MPCSICGLEGHNAKSCTRRVVAGLTAAGGETQVSAAADSAGSTVGNVLVASDGTPAAKKQRIDSFASPVSVPKDDDVNADVVTVMVGICECSCVPREYLLTFCTCVRMLNAPPGGAGRFIASGPAADEMIELFISGRPSP